MERCDEHSVAVAEADKQRANRSALIGFVGESFAVDLTKIMYKLQH